MMRIGSVVAGLGLMAAMAAPAAAHVDNETLARFGPFLAGLSHPVLGPDHLLAMFTVGLVSAILGGRHFWTVPLVFVACMPLGWVLGRLGVPFPPVEFGIALSVLVLGLAGFFAQRLPIPAIYAGVAMFSLFHGYAHGAETPDTANLVQYVLGFVAGTAGLHLLGLFVGDILYRPDGRNLPVKALSGIIALGGAWFLLGVVMPV